ADVGETGFAVVAFDADARPLEAGGVHVVDLDGVELGVSGLGVGDDDAHGDVASGAAGCVPSADKIEVLDSETRDVGGPEAEAVAGADRGVAGSVGTNDDGRGGGAGVGGIEDYRAVGFVQGEIIKAGDGGAGGFDDPDVGRSERRRRDGGD